MQRCIVWIPQGLAGLLAVCLAVLGACKGPAGPPGLLKNGRISGQITVWEDALSSSQNTPTIITAGGFTVAVVGDSTKTATTGQDGRYEIPNAPAGTYIVVTSRDSTSAIGYGTMRRYNFVVGGGPSFHSGDIGRKAPKPTTVSAVVESVAAVSGGKDAAIKVSWSVTPTAAQFASYGYLITLQSASVVATVGPFLFATTDLIFVGINRPGTYNVSVQTDLGLSYIDQSTGKEVFPTRSSPTVAPTSVTLTRPNRLMASMSPRMLAREFPGKRIYQAVIKE